MSPARPFFLRATVAILGALLGAGCGSKAPPEPPPRMEAPGLGIGADWTEEDVGPALFPPSVTEAERRDPILGSPVAEHPEVRSRVNYWILRWQTWGQGYFTRYLERMERWSEIVDEEIAARRLPPSLRYLPVVESGYNPHAVSRAGATGMWQFMSGTARFLGLEVTPLLDERRDPWRSTEVALDYLVELNERFGGSWFLALAAYNGGWGRVQRILDRHGGGAAPSDSLFWALRDRFPRETREFVPKLLAAARLARNPEAYGLAPDVGTAAVRAAEVRVPDATSLDVVARSAGVSLEEVERLNPHVRRGYTPPERETALRIPAGAAEGFDEAFRKIPRAERVSFVEHRIRRGETLTHLASRYGVEMAELRAANPGLEPRRLQIGQWVVVPRSPRSEEAGAGDVRIAAAGETGGEDPSGPDAGSGGADVEEAVRVHRVRRGESLWLIARRHGVGVADLRRWNGLASDPVLHPGDELRIRGAPVAVYRVRAGDTLSDIALRHGVPTESLLRANDLNRSSVIRPGDEVRIPAQPGS